MSSSAEHLKIDPALATAIRFSADRLHVELSDGREISVPLDRFPRLAGAAAQERLARVRPRRHRPAAGP